MNINLTNQEQATTTINAKRYDAARVIREFCDQRNKAENYWVNDSLEIQVTEHSVVIRDISGDFTILTR